MKIGSKTFDDKNKTYIMGILNITPDSFSDGGKFLKKDNALFRAEQMIKEGCDIIDIGAESTRPGFIPVSEIEEINRLIEPLREIKKRFDVPVSIDTYKEGVARTVLLEGADMINDISGILKDDGAARAAAEAGASYCYMHNRLDTGYRNLMNDVLNEMSEGINRALSVGISRERLMIDPGIGFGKTPDQNLVVLKHLNSFLDLGFPVLVGASRKSVIGKATGLDVLERLEGTLAVTVMCVLSGMSFVRVHDIKENRRVIEMTEAVINSER